MKITIVCSLKDSENLEIVKMPDKFCEDPQAELGGKRARGFLLKLENKCKIVEQKNKIKL